MLIYDETDPQKANKELKIYWKPSSRLFPSKFGAKRRKDGKRVTA
jgi:hypothetical protein